MDWIDVNKELPKEGEEVLIVADECNKVLIAEFNPNGVYYWDCDEYGVEKNEVSSWMRIPKPPINSFKK